MDQHLSPRPGWIEVITGSMFSGKSEELIRRLRRAQIARIEPRDVPALDRFLAASQEIYDVAFGEFAAQPFHKFGTCSG